MSARPEGVAWFPVLDLFDLFMDVRQHQIKSHRLLSEACPCLFLLAFLLLSLIWFILEVSFRIVPREVRCYPSDHTRSKDPFPILSLLGQRLDIGLKGGKGGIVPILLFLGLGLTLSVGPIKGGGGERNVCPFNCYLANLFDYISFKHLLESLHQCWKEGSCQAILQYICYNVKANPLIVMLCFFCYRSTCFIDWTSDYIGTAHREPLMYMWSSFLIRYWYQSTRLKVVNMAGHDWLRREGVETATMFERRQAPLDWRIW